MGKQINFYVKLPDIEKAEKYLKDRDFVFIQDPILNRPEIVSCERLFSLENKARYISLPRITPDFHRSFQQYQSKKRQILHFR